MAKKVKAKSNKKVRGASKKIYDGIKFDSALEVNCYKLLKESNIKFEYSSRTYELMPKFRLNSVSSYDFSKSKGYGQTFTKAGLKKVYSNMTLTPDFIIGKNPSRYEILYQLNAKRHALYSREYMLCKNCLLQDYDQARKMPKKCPVCGSKNVELIIEDE